MNLLSHNYLTLNISTSFAPEAETFSDYLTRMSNKLAEMSRAFDEWEAAGNEPSLSNFLRSHPEYEEFAELGNY